MLRQAEWNDNPELMEAVVMALDIAEEPLAVQATNEQSSYGDDGSVIINKDGRRFYLQLMEEV